MTPPVTRGRRPPAWRLAGIGLLAIGVAAALYAAGRLIQPDYAFSLFGTDPIPVKSLLATIALALAGVQVLLALWMYRELPLAAGPPRPVPVVHRVTGFALFAVTVPVAVHCLIAGSETRGNQPDRRWRPCRSIGRAAALSADPDDMSAFLATGGEPSPIRIKRYARLMPRNPHKALTVGDVRDSWMVAHVASVPQLSAPTESTRTARTPVQRLERQRRDQRLLGKNRRSLAPL